jgi:hypothetical protein
MARCNYINAAAPEVPFAEAGTPTWDGLPLDRYLSLLDMLNPMHRLWSDARWNKLTVAHGCYWKKCSFCDVSLDYIARYEAAAATTLVDRIEAIVAETGQTGFHFVDEAAPPKALKAVADELRKRGRAISWWGNIRFEKSFTPDLCADLAASGCIAVSGGLEVASDRLLKLMQKGVSVDQVARVTHAFTEAGILVHAYLMYGFPTQTVQDTVDALEYVRQLFAAGCIQSGFFHRFTCSVHSPVGLQPERYGVSLKPLPAGRFARNDVGFIDPDRRRPRRPGPGIEQGALQLHARHRPGAGCALVVRAARAEDHRGTRSSSRGRCADERQGVDCPGRGVPVTKARGGTASVAAGAHGAAGLRQHRAAARHHRHRRARPADHALHPRRRGLLRACLGTLLPLAAEEPHLRPADHPNGGATAASRGASSGWPSA